MSDVVNPGEDPTEDPDGTADLTSETRHERPTPRPRVTKQRAVALAAGTTVGRYVIIGQLGEGGMAVVYRAYDPDLDRGIALKCVRPESTSLGHTDVKERCETRGPSQVDRVTARDADSDTGCDHAPGFCRDPRGALERASRMGE